jgi:YidC/Oxa1 family membrane protein insertase
VTPLVANIFQPLIDAAEAVIVFLHDDVGFGWGMAIVGLTFITRLLILPLSIKQIKSMRALQELQPQMKEIQEKYKDDRERMQREMMAFYQENGINPLASCWPLLLQLPVFLSLFYLLQGDSFQADVEAAPPVGWLFIESLVEKPAGTELVILIALFIGTQLAAGMVMASRVEGPQRIIMFVLPVVIAPFIITQPAGLAVYWISTNIWTLGQQYVVKRVAPPPEAAKPEVVAAAKAAKPPPPPPRKKKKRKWRDPWTPSTTTSSRTRSCRRIRPAGSRRSSTACSTSSTSMPTSRSLSATTRSSPRSRARTTSAC